MGRFGDFEEFMKASDREQKEGLYANAMDWATMAMDVAKNDEELALALNKRAWAARFIGYKTDDLLERNLMYWAAKHDWKRVLGISRRIDTLVSAIKGLMLLPDEDVEELCELGKKEIEKRISDSQKKENLKAELINSAAIRVRERDPEKAEEMFLVAYKTVEKKTTIAGHLLHNAGVCHLILKDKAADRTESYKHAIKALACLDKALEEYPEDQKEHKRAVQTKIGNVQREISRYFNWKCKVEENAR